MPKVASGLSEGVIMSHFNLRGQQCRNQNQYIWAVLALQSTVPPAGRATSREEVPLTPGLRVRMRHTGASVCEGTCSRRSATSAGPSPGA